MVLGFYCELAILLAAGSCGELPSVYILSPSVYSHSLYFQIVKRNNLEPHNTAVAEGHWLSAKLGREDSACVRVLPGALQRV